MSISAEEKNHYLREAAIVLAREGFHTDRTHAGGLRVLLDGAPLCEVTENGGITYRNEDIDEPERIDAKDKVYEIVRTTAEYMRQMETAPFLKADGLEDGYKVLADFNDIVLAGIQSKYGVQFVTWDWSFDRKGVSHGHYYTGLYSSGNYEAAKRDFATRSGLIPEQQLFREKQLIEIYRCCTDTLQGSFELSYDQEKTIQDVRKQIEECLPDIMERMPSSGMRCSKSIPRNLRRVEIAIPSWIKRSLFLKLTPSLLIKCRPFLDKIISCSAFIIRSIKRVIDLFIEQCIIKESK